MNEPTPSPQVGQAVPAFGNTFWSAETVIMMALAIAVGIAAALGTAVTVWLITFVRGLFFEDLASILSSLGSAYVIILPVLGALAAGPLVYVFSSNSHRYGAPEVFTAVTGRRGRIRTVVVLAQALGAAIMIGSGASAGREGPIVQISSGFGSRLGRFFKLADRGVMNLVLSGAAGGIAATFNAPLAGVIFALEVIGGNLATQTYPTVLVSALTASLVTRLTLGNSPAFRLPAFTLTSGWELLLYLGLGIVAGTGAVAFVKTIYLMEAAFNGLKIPPYLKLALGGLVVGVLGFFLPQVFGMGFETIEGILTGRVGLVLLLILILAKILATSLSLGSGAPGGVFGPALFIGTAVGGAFGALFHSIFPEVAVLSGGYAMVGMAAAFAGAARAPITASILLFELTGDFHIIIPLLLATIVSTLLVRQFEPVSIYTRHLKLRPPEVVSRKNGSLMHGGDGRV